jgi:hypothetical protein
MIDEDFFVRWFVYPWFRFDPRVRHAAYS